MAQYLAFICTLRTKGCSDRRVPGPIQLQVRITSSIILPTPPPYRIEYPCVSDRNHREPNRLARFVSLGLYATFLECQEKNNHSRFLHTLIPSIVLFPPGRVFSFLFPRLWRSFCVIPFVAHSSAFRGLLCPARWAGRSRYKRRYIYGWDGMYQDHYDLI